ncbi:MAG: SPOR domain-containing protein [Hydrogenophaga sp.]|nr:SPOR domain-containing protein [Hydrogenophaga sp.]
MTETPPAAPAMGTQAQPQAASATEALYRAALGSERLAHYLPVFARFDELGVARPHWNLAAATLSWHWLLYRRLWREALVYLLALAVALALWWWLPTLWPGMPAGVRWGLLAAIAVVAVAAPGWWGDAWLHADVRRRMTAAVRRARTVQEACALLASPSAARRVWLLVLVLELGVLAAWRFGAFGPAPVDPPPVPEPLVGERPADPAPVAPAATAAPSPAVADNSAPAPAPGGETAAPPAAAPMEPASATPEPAAPAADPTPPAEPRTRLGGHGVAVGIFGDPANAERAAQRLRGAGLPVVSDPVESARGSLTRVRVGPFSTREEAQEAAETVRNLGLEARLYGPR